MGEKAGFAEMIFLIPGALPLTRKSSIFHAWLSARGRGTSVYKRVLWAELFGFITGLIGWWRNWVMVLLMIYIYIYVS